MEYPLISEYREAILAAEDNFNELSSLRPVLDGRGDPVMSSGNFAVVFKMRDSRDGTFYAVKCFIKDQEGRDEGYRKIADELDSVSSSYILPLRYLEDELFVDSEHCDTEEFPVVVMEWVEGETLDSYIKRNLSDVYSLGMLSYRFNRMAAWLLAQPFAHGDLKPDNILVRHDGSLVLVDYDGMYVPAMKGEKARETGSPDYRHPLRSSDDFNEQIDDFPIALIAMSLKVIAMNPGLKRTGIGKDTLLLTAADFRDIAKSETMAKIQALSTDPELSLLLGAFYIALAKNSLDLVSFRLFMTPKPKKEENLSTERTDEDLKNGIEDEYGVIYSKDGKRLLTSRYTTLKEYTVKEGTKIICDNAFCDCLHLESIELPETITKIGNYVFRGCGSLRNINLPLSLISMGKNPFALGLDPFTNCKQVLQLIVPKGSKFKSINGLLIDAGRVVAYLNDDRNIKLPELVTEIGDSAFWYCKSLRSIEFADSVNKIGDYAFCWCWHLESIELPETITKIGNYVFEGCKSLKNISLPLSLTSLGENPFVGCKQLQLRLPQGSKFKSKNGLLIDTGRLVSCLNNDKCIALHESVTEIGDSAFSGCESLQSIVLPESVTKIGNEAFSECINLQSINLPLSLISLGKNPFGGCEQLQLIVPQGSKFKFINGLLIDAGRLVSCLNNDKDIELPESITEIGDMAFYGSYDKSSWESIKISDSLTKIGNYAFYFCGGLTSIVLPDSVTKIGNGAFWGCTSLYSIELPDSVTEIDDDVFYGCYQLQWIVIPKSLKNVKFKDMPSVCEIVVR